MYLHPPFLRSRVAARQRGESGQALIETAVTIAMLSIMLLGAAELGRIAYAAIQVTTAAKAAVQYGSRTSGTAGDITGMKIAAALAAPALPNIAANTTINSTCLCADGASCQLGDANDCPGSAMVQTLHVTTSASFDPIIHLPGMPTTYTLNGKAVQQVLSNGF